MSGLVAVASRAAEKIDAARQTLRRRIDRSGRSPPKERQMTEHSSAPSSPSSEVGAEESALAVLEREIVAARIELRRLWRSAAPADRVFAVDRLLRDDLLSPALQAGLQSIQDVVRDRWVTARVASTLKSVTADARIAALNHTIAEQERDNFLEAHALFDALFATAEGYLRAVPADGGRPFRELLRARELERARLVPILPPIDDNTASG
jgi:hypothetical protein